MTRCKPLLLWAAVLLFGVGCGGADQDPPIKDLGPASDGQVLNKDGSTAKKDGSAVKKDGSAVKKDGPAVKKDGPAVKKDGPAVKKDGPAVKKDGPAVKKDGPAVKKDGSAVKKDGPVVKKDGPAPKPDQAAPKPDQALPPADAGSPVPYTGSFPPGTGDLSATLTVAGLSRSVRIYKPSKAGPNAPLMLTFHGTHGKAYDMLKPYSAYAREMADKEGVILVSPQARKMSVGDWDNHYPNDVYWETYPSLNPQTNPDLLLVRALIQEAKRAYNVDLKRVYTLGHSNGGFFSIFVAMTLPNQIAGFAENSSGLVRCATMQACQFVGSGTSCAAYQGQSGYCGCSGTEKPAPLSTSGRKPPGYLSHAADDSRVSVEYTCALAGRMTALGYKVSLNISSGGGHSMPVNYGVKAWAYLSAFRLP